MKDLQSIKDFFVEHTKFNESDIKTCEFYYDGYTNFSYIICCYNLQKFQIKITRFKHPTMINEALIYKQYLPSYLLYYDDMGNLIKQWTEGEDFNFNKNINNRIDMLFAEVKKFQSMKPSKDMSFFDYYIYEDIFLTFPDEYKKYKNILSKFNKAQMVVSHNDVNFKNTILFKQNGLEKIHFIDFEWTTLNYQWMDYINLFCEDEIYDEKILMLLISRINLVENLNDIFELLFVRWFFTLGWSTFEMERLPGMKQYQERCFKNISFLKKKLI